MQFYLYYSKLKADPKVYQITNTLSPNFCLVFVLYEIRILSLKTFIFSVCFRATQSKKRPISTPGNRSQHSFSILFSILSLSVLHPDLCRTYTLSQICHRISLFSQSFFLPTVHHIHLFYPSDFPKNPASL